MTNEINYPRTKDEYQKYLETLTLHDLFYEPNNWDWSKSNRPRQDYLDDHRESVIRFINRTNSFKALFNAQPQLDESFKDETGSGLQQYTVTGKYKCTNCFMSTFGKDRPFILTVFNKPLCRPYNNPHQK